MNLNELLSEEPNLDGLTALLAHPFDIDTADFSLVFHIGQKQRDKSKNSHDYSVEATVFLFYTIHQMHIFGVSGEASRLFLKLISPYQSYFAAKQKDRKLSDEAKLRILEILEEIKDSRNHSTIGYVLRESKNHFLSAMRQLGEIESHSSIDGIYDKMLNAICCIELIYDKVAGDYFPV